MAIIGLYTGDNAFNNTRRCGVIPYSYDEKTGTIWICLGIDKNSGDFTDYGGGRKKNENAVTAASREFREETEGVFDLSFYHRDHKYLVASNKNSAVIFQPLKILGERQDVAEAIEKRLNEKSEMSGVIWLPFDQFEKIITTTTKPMLYTPVKELMRNIIKKYRLGTFLVNHWCKEGENIPVFEKTVVKFPSTNFPQTKWPVATQSVSISTILPVILPPKKRKICAPRTQTRMIRTPQILATPSRISGPPPFPVPKQWHNNFHKVLSTPKSSALYALTVHKFGTISSTGLTTSLSPQCLVSSSKDRTL
jgi:hypothetical protein